MRLIGLTGGIASGKSAASRMLRAAGIDVVDADELARDVVAQGSEGLAEVVLVFGPGVLLADGALDRKALGARVFGDDGARRALNGITHPRIAQLAAERTAAIAARGVEACVYDAPLLFENGLDAMMDATILIAVPEDVQLARLIARDGLDEAAARARVAAQLPLAEKIKRATVVIDNAGPLTETARQLARAWRELTGRDVVLVA